VWQYALSFDLTNSKGSVAQVGEKIEKAVDDAGEVRKETGKKVCKTIE